MKNCQWCDASFEAKVKYQIYCSEDCRVAATKEKIANRYAISRRNKLIGKDRRCVSCNGKLSAYNDETLCMTCMVNPKDVSKALREMKGLANGKEK